MNELLLGMASQISELEDRIVVEDLRGELWNQRGWGPRGLGAWGPCRVNQQADLGYPQCRNTQEHQDQQETLLRRQSALNFFFLDLQAHVVFILNSLFLSICGEG